jgi:hypothetical protein
MAASSARCVKDEEMSGVHDVVWGAKLKRETNQFNVIPQCCPDRATKFERITPPSKIREKRPVKWRTWAFQEHEFRNQIAFSAHKQ